MFTDAEGKEVRAAMEIQFHHRQEDGRIVVVAVPVKVNAESSLLKTVLSKIPETCKDESLHDEPNLEDLMPFERHFYLYYGTTTQPPCTDDTTW